jgi:RNA polymerase sigma-70 factor (ECF subfamily)
MNRGGFRSDRSQDPAALPSQVESSAVLLQKARNGDRQALDLLCHRYLPLLHRWASHRLPPWARDLLNTDDLVQDTLLHTLNHITEFEPRHEGAFQAYLRQAVHNRILNEMRRVRRKPPQDPLPVDGQDLRPSPLEETVGQEVMHRYEEALKKLKPEDREAIVARIEMDLGYERVAVALGKPTPDAARVAVGRALVRLAQEMRLERAR